MAVTQATMRGVPLVLLSAVTTGTSPGITIPTNSDNCIVEVVGAGTIAGGTLVLEENASDPNYSGTWSLMQTITANTLTGGAAQVIHILGSIRFFRTRITSNISGGGTITVNFVAS